MILTYRNISFFFSYFQGSLGYSSILVYNLESQGLQNSGTGYHVYVLIPNIDSSMIVARASLFLN